MRQLISKPEENMQMEDYDIHVVGLDLSETFPHDKMVLAKITQRVVYVDYEWLDRKLRKCEVELENVKGIVRKL